MEYKSFYKKVGGGEGQKCKYPTRLDTYGCGCQHDCSYCYAKSLLDFRGLWDAQSPRTADPEKVVRKIGKLEPGSVVRMGGMTDCFAPVERTKKVTYRALEAMRDRGVHALIVTKSDLVAADEYMDVMDRDLVHIQVSITSTSDVKNFLHEVATPPLRRIAAVEKLHDAGYDVAVRLSPYIPELVDADVVNAIRCDKLQVEFLRVNHWIERWMRCDLSAYTHREGGYRHLPLERKVELLGAFSGKQVSVCEDVQEHYEYWREHVNPNRGDCCNLRM